VNLQQLKSVDGYVVANATICKRPAIGLESNKKAANPWD
jgi:hypothetical protein